MRCTRHPAPVIEPALLRIRPFAIAAGAATVFFAGFGAMLLASVLLLTGPWEQDMLQAGLGIAPGPAMAALCSVPGARLARRVGMAPVGALGAALFGAGSLWWLTQVGPEPEYATAFLPGMLVGGAGVGLVIPTVTGAATAALPPARLATGTAVVTTGRQLGIALGVAALVALLGGSAGSADDLRAVYAFILATSVASGLALAALGGGVAAAPVGEAAPA